MDFTFLSTLAGWKEQGLFKSLVLGVGGWNFPSYYFRYDDDDDDGDDDDDDDETGVAILAT
jgi:hypothetical protein